MSDVTLPLHSLDTILAARAIPHVRGKVPPSGQERVVPDGRLAQGRRRGAAWEKRLGGSTRSSVETG